MISFHVTRRTRVLTSHVFDVETREVADGTTSFTRDVVVHPGAVAILAIRADGAVALLRQYRATFDDVNWELPAGTLDVAGESPRDAAVRELREETGCEATSVHEIFRYMNSRGWTDQITIVFTARDLVQHARTPLGPEELASEIHWLTRDELRALLDRGELMEASTLMGLLWYLSAGVG